MAVEKVKDLFLYIVMAGLPARGKSTVANKLRDSLKSDGIRTRIFNNGDLRRRLSKENTAYPEFFDPNNETGSALRERCSAMTLKYARTFINDDPAERKVAIIDASNVSRKRREKILKALPEERVLFIECINDDNEILEANLLHKVDTPEFAHLSREEAVASFKKRIRYYEATCQPLGKERNFIKLDTFQQNSRFFTWLYRIAFNSALSRRRRRRARVSLDQFRENAGVEVVDGSDGVDEPMLRRERVAMVRHALQTLTDEHRAILVLREMEEHSYETISEILEISIGTVRSRLSRARRQLKQALEGLQSAEETKTRRDASALGSTEDDDAKGQVPPSAG